MNKAKITSIVMEMITHLDSVNELPNAAKFKSTIDIQVSEKAEGAHGGVNKKGTPSVYFGLKGREFNEQFYINYAESKYEPRQKTWKKCRQLAQEGKKMFIEYSHIWKDPEIGSFVSDDLYHHQRALIAHELSHAVQYWKQKHDTEYQYNGYQGDRNKYRGHREIFQYTYRLLRNKFVNTYVESIHMHSTPENLATVYNRTSPKGAVQLTWDIYDSQWAEHGWQCFKEMLIEAAMEEGINSGTASTQFYKWKKDRKHPI